MRGDRCESVDQYWIGRGAQSCCLFIFLPFKVYNTGHWGASDVAWEGNHEEGESVRKGGKKLNEFGTSPDLRCLEGRGLSDGKLSSSNRVFLEANNIFC